MTHEEDQAEKGDLLISAQQRLVREMEEISHRDEAGHVVKDMVTSTACLLPLIAPEFVPQVTTIYTPERIEKMLLEFGERLLSSQAQWANRWNKRRG